MQLYNSLTQKLELLKTLEKNKVRLYVCGITPYDTTHLGHAFLYTFFDALNRYLSYKGYQVNYVQNVTDIDDDILRKAKENALSSPKSQILSKKIDPSTLIDWKSLGKYWTDKFLTDLKALNIQMPTHYVKATDSIPTIIKIIHDLLAKDLAYNRNGTIFFRTSQDPQYGKLSHFTNQQMILLSKERGANPDDPRKENPLDFILWQASPKGEVKGPPEPSWPTPWGNGRPGWHIECSAMNYDYLGEQIDIHGGGRDLIYPHHESEIAQSESFTGKKPFSQFWLHTAMVMYQGEKMSKSLGNLIMVSDLLKTYSPNVIRYFLLSHHYRIPWEYTEQDLQQAEEKINVIENQVSNDSWKQSLQNENIEISYDTQFQTTMDNDINTPQALEILTDLAQQLTKAPNPKLQRTLTMLYSTLGFTHPSFTNLLQSGTLNAGFTSSISSGNH